MTTTGAPCLLYPLNPTGLAFSLRGFPPALPFPSAIHHVENSLSISFRVQALQVRAEAGSDRAGGGAHGGSEVDQGTKTQGKRITCSTLTKL